MPAGGNAARARSLGMESSGNVKACRFGSSVFVRVWGRAQADLCPALRRYCEEALGGRCSEVRVDLQECAHFDSTFLGTLLHLRKCLRHNADRAVTLVRPSTECQELLQRMGAARLFPVAAEPPPADDAGWVHLNEEAAGRGSLAFKRNVVEAHQELAKVDGALGDRYRMIAELAAQDLESAQRR
jgi:anti-anti-sigma regulatory factor